MSEIYVYSANCDDFANFGLVGALTPTSCYFEEEANGMSEITMEHPIDGFGRHTQLACNNLLMVEVPVRTTPEINGTSIVTSVEQWTVKNEATITKAMRSLYKRATGSSRLKYVPGGTAVTVVDKPEEGRYKVKCAYGTGYMEPDALNFVQSIVIPDNSQSIESVEPAWTVKPQLFRIYSVEKGIAGLTVSARHISYDLLYNLTTYKNTGETSCQAALAGIMGNCVSPHEFSAYTNLASVRTGINWTRTNPIDALLNPETGLTALYGASLVRDNWEMYVLHDPGLNRGVTIEYGKNMTGIKYTKSYEEVVTRIIPIGETKDGEDLLLEGDKPWVDSVHINDYPVVYTQELKCENCKVGTDGVTLGMAQARMKEQAQSVFDAGSDLPEVEMSVDFINLGDTAEYAQYKNLERFFLWDYVIVRHKLHGIDDTSRIVSIKWNCMLDRMEGMEIGAVGKTLANSGITTWQIPTGFLGSKIAGGTVGNAALQTDIISARHMQAESVNTKALQAKAVTADKIAAGAITAEKIKTGELDAITINAFMAEIERLTAGEIEADTLTSTLADFVVLTAGSADFDQATIQHLVAQAMNLEFGTAGQVFIKNLAVEYANMVSAAVGELCIKASDGNYYLLDVNETGGVTATFTTVTEGEINAGQTSGGKVILETNMTVKNLNTTNLLGTYALINKIDAARIDVDQLFAREAFITLLRTSRIVGEKSIEMIAEEAQRGSKTFRQEDPPDWDVVRPGDTWIVRSTGESFTAAESESIFPSFYLGSDGCLYFASEDENLSFSVQGGYLYSNRLKLEMDGEEVVHSPLVWVLVENEQTLIHDSEDPPPVAAPGKLWMDRGLTPPLLRRWRGLNLPTDDMDGWETVNDAATIEAAQAELADRQAALEAGQREVSTYLRLDQDMVRIGKKGVTSEFQIDPWGARVRVNGRVFSRFEADRVRFGNMEIRMPAAGGLMLDAVDSMLEVNV